MPSLDSSLRDQLATVIGKENADSGARIIAEAGGRAAIEALAVHLPSPYAHLDAAQKQLRNRLRARARQLGDTRHADGRHEIGRLIEQAAYEHWHRMLFARFLAENDLLIHPEMKVPVTLEECAELAASEGAVDGWELAGRYASRMLPQIFRPDDPLLAVRFAIDDVKKLEKQLDSLPAELFRASDSLGWCYQFWQARKKKEVNASEVKIGADELPAVTQLFTEPYMVSFLLHNTLGAWWAGKVGAASRRSPASEAEARQACALPGISWEYLRFVQSAAPVYLDRDAEVAISIANLPHWRQTGVTYFVTFRTGDSLPAEQLEAWRAERDAFLRAHPEPHDAAISREYHRRFSDRLNRWLDQGAGACQLRRPELRQIVEKALRHFDGDRYVLDAYAVAANHVHVIVTPAPGHELSDILHSWKSFTAKKINEALETQGSFWQKESFDHILRSPDQLVWLREYVKGHGEGVWVREEVDEAAGRRFYPAAGTFDGWPRIARELKVLDPCCGSGHFLVAAFEILVGFRMAEEGLTAREACDAVLRDNLFGLEIDARCVQIAAFAVALAAWTYPEAGGYRPLAPMNVACSGLAISAKREDWENLGGDNARLRAGMGRMWELFSDAAVLGSLIDPSASPDGPLYVADFVDVEPELRRAIRLSDVEAEPEAHEARVAAQGIAAAARLLLGRYTLAVTNPPYLLRGKQSETLKRWCGAYYPEGAGDLATVFFERCRSFCEVGGTHATVTPQNWLFLGSYTRLRQDLLNRQCIVHATRIGSGATATASWDVLRALAIVNRDKAENYRITGLEASEPTEAGRATELLEGYVLVSDRSKQSRNPDQRIALGVEVSGPLLREYADSLQGISTGDGSRFVCKFWEVPDVGDCWARFQSTVRETLPFGGKEHVVFWEFGEGRMVRSGGSAIRGLAAQGKLGVSVTQMRRLPATIFCGTLFDTNAAAIIPKNPEHAPAIWAFCSSDEFNEAVRQVDQKIGVTNASLAKVPFDLARWQQVAMRQLPAGLPQPTSQMADQWLFHGAPRRSEAPLHVAVARLLGYRWPDQQPDAIDDHADKDGIVCIPALRGERPAADRLTDLLAAAWVDAASSRVQNTTPTRLEGASTLSAASAASASTPGAPTLNWHPQTLTDLLAAAGHHGTLEEWLRDAFFKQHCELFHHRPFIWHIWDGHRAGFSALVNYHKLTHEGLKSLTYSYLGDWIRTVEIDAKAEKSGAGDKLTKAKALQQRLAAILEGEAPLDIFVRWKPIEQQPIGWFPDLDDGVRLNIRPFLTVADVGAKGAGVLRWKPNISWGKDRGKNPPGAPWGEDRDNDKHLTLAEKHKAQGR